MKRRGLGGGVYFFRLFVVYGRIPASRGPGFPGLRFTPASSSRLQRDCGGPFGPLQSLARRKQPKAVNWTMRPRGAPARLKPGLHLARINTVALRRAGVTFFLSTPLNGAFLLRPMPAGAAEGCELDNAAPHSAIVCPQIEKCAPALAKPTIGKRSLFI